MTITTKGRRQHIHILIDGSTSMQDEETIAKIKGCDSTLGSEKVAQIHRYVFFNDEIHRCDSLEACEKKLTGVDRYTNFPATLDAIQKEIATVDKSHPEEFSKNQHTVVLITDNIFCSRAAYEGKSESDGKTVCEVKKEVRETEANNVQAAIDNMEAAGISVSVSSIESTWTDDEHTNNPLVALDNQCNISPPLPDFSPNTKLFRGEPNLDARQIHPDAVAVGNGSGMVCSGVLIERDVVLTASHCKDLDRVAVGASIYSATDVIDVIARVDHPDKRIDAALLLLKRPARNTTPVTRRTAKETTPPSGMVRHAGFGASDSTGRYGFGRKHYTDIYTNGWRCSLVEARRTGCIPRKEMTLSGSGGRDTCQGDSGGPVYEHSTRREERDGGKKICTCKQWKLLAITSRAVKRARVACGAGGVYVRADAIAEWIDKVTKQWSEEKETRSAKVAGRQEES